MNESKGGNTMMTTKSTIALALVMPLLIIGAVNETKAEQPIPSVTVNNEFRIITESPLPSGIVGVHYSTEIVTSGGKSPIKGIFSRGSPYDYPGCSGLSFLHSRISGVPTRAGKCAVMFRARDSRGIARGKRFSFMVMPKKQKVKRK